MSSSRKELICFGWTTLFSYPLPSIIALHFQEQPGGRGWAGMGMGLYNFSPFPDPKIHPPSLPLGARRAFRPDWGGEWKGERGGVRPSPESRKPLLFPEVNSKT